MTIRDLKIKHDKLKKLDGGGLFKNTAYRIFGSDAHKYRFSTWLTEGAIDGFETTHRIALPPDYKNFLLRIGNGGSGPAYGLLPLQDWNTDLEIRDDHFLSVNFPHTDKWNMNLNDETDDGDDTGDDKFEEWEDKYYSDSHVTGSIRICHYGCAIYYILVLTGENAGQVWVDDRAGSQGIYPAISKSTDRRLTFIEWYDEWLTESIDKCLLKQP